jgi:hypothetical protein
MDGNTKHKRPNKRLSCPFFLYFLSSVRPSILSIVTSIVKLSFVSLFLSSFLSLNFVFVCLVCLCLSLGSAFVCGGGGSVFVFVFVVELCFCLSCLSLSLGLPFVFGVCLYFVSLFMPSFLSLNFVFVCLDPFF